MFENEHANSTKVVGARGSRVCSMASFGDVDRDAGACQDVG